MIKIVYTLSEKKKKTNSWSVRNFGEIKEAQEINLECNCLFYEKLYTKTILYTSGQECISIDLSQVVLSLVVWKLFEYHKLFFPNMFLCFNLCHCFILRIINSIFFNFHFYFILLYNTVLVLPYIDMNPPRVYIQRMR